MARSLDLSTLSALAGHPACVALKARPSPPDVAIVGGTVRDTLLGRKHPDLDLCVTADPEEVASALRGALGGSWFVLDPVFGVVRFHAGGQEVDLALRQGESWDADLRRRDLTINALGLVMVEGGVPVEPPLLRDPTGGLGDLEARLVRATSRAALEADPVRTLRVFRFGAVLDFAIDPQTRGWVAELAPALRQVAMERVRDELFKLLAAPRCAPHLAGVADAGLLEVAIPELAWARGTASTGHFDGFRHRLEAVRVLDWLLSRESPLPADLRDFLAEHLAAPLSGGRSRGALVRAAMMLQGLPRPADDLARDLRLATAEVRYVRAAVRGMSEFADLPAAPGGAALYRFFRAAGDAAEAAVLLALADHLAARDLAVVDDAWPLATAVAILAEARQPSVTEPREPLVRGDALIAALRIPAGPQVAALLEAIAEARADGQVGTAEEALAYARRIVEAGTEAGPTGAADGGGPTRAADGGPTRAADGGSTRAADS
ncbi:MAG: CCA tRNA nucleotidyltransferase [Candidatus Sericytochromatia bacterium]|nr:CCA tRNA nucleotidyltransferase [Candidatus Tanganyikabacteria bacterium]